MTTDDVRADARRLLQGITPGPWEVNNDGWATISSGPDSVIHAYSEHAVCDCGAEVEGSPEVAISIEDAEFIAAAPTLVDRLLAELGRSESDVVLTNVELGAALAERDAALATLQEVRPALEDADHRHRWTHSCEVEDVRCGCCDLRYGERDEYTCCSQYGIHNHAHRFDDEELTAARACSDDCPPWYQPMLDGGGS